ncbi:MAG: hypothetical protein L6R28_25495, partial [Planctomycetes bacterium]|nr:hypothetical protein [Planctomycetota bacterium]
YQFLVAQLVVDDLVKGDVMRGSTLKVRVAAAEGKDALGKFDVGWAEKPADGQSKWEAQVPGGRLFALKADPDELAFRPLLMDFPAETADEASAKRKAVLGSLCKAYRGKPGFALPETLSDEDILARLHATKVEKLDGGKYRLTYDFSSPEELKDWYVINPLGEWAVADGWLTQSCNESNNEDYMALVLATCAGFSGDVSATVRLNPVDNDCFSVHIAHYCRRQTYTFLMNSDYGKVWEARRVIGKRLAKNEDRLWSFQGDYDQTKTYTICLARKGKTIFAKLDGKLLFSADDEVLTTGSVALGCKGMQGIRYDSVVIEGRFDGRWSQVEPAAPVAKHPEAKAEKPKAQEDAAKPVVPPVPNEAGPDQF